MKTVQFNEVESKLINGIPSKIRAIDSSNVSIYATPDEMLNALNRIGNMKRIFIPRGISIFWARVIEVNNMGNCCFIANMQTYNNQPPAIAIGSIYSYEGISNVSIKQLVGRMGEIYNPNFKYKVEGRIIKVWATASVISDKSCCLNILSGNATYPMVKEDPPADAIEPVWI